MVNSTNTSVSIKATNQRQSKTWSKASLSAPYTFDRVVKKNENAAKNEVKDRGVGSLREPTAGSINYARSGTMGKKIYNYFVNQLKS